MLISRVEMAEEVWGGGEGETERDLYMFVCVFVFVCVCVCVRVCVCVKLCCQNTFKIYFSGCTHAPCFACMHVCLQVWHCCVSGGGQEREVTGSPAIPL